MREPRLFIYDVLGVPYGLLESKDPACRRAAAAQLLRRVPRLRNLLLVHDHPDWDFPDRFEPQLEAALRACGLVIDIVSDALAAGDLDSIIGGYPDESQRRPIKVIEALQDRVLAQDVPDLELPEILTVDDVLKDAEETAEPTARADWLRLTVHILVVEITAWVGRQGWPADEPPLDT